MSTTANIPPVSAELHRDLSLVLPEARAASATESEATINGQSATIDPALGKARQFLRDSIAPAIVGLNGLSIEGVREAVALAEICRAKLLPTPLPDPAAARMTVTQTATLGHAMAADLKVVVGAGGSRSPAARQEPRLPTLADRIDETITARVPNTLFVNGDLDTVIALRNAARKHGAAVFTDTTALPVKRVIVLLQHDCDARVVSEWHHLSADMQRSLRVAVLSLPHPIAANLRGVLEVITWQTGLTCAAGGVDFADGSPRPCAGAAELLPRGACDVVIDTGWSPMPFEWRKHGKHYIRIGADDRPAPLTARPTPSPLRGERAEVRGETNEIAGSTDLCFVTPGLALGLAARVMRFDGTILWLCDDPTPGAAWPDPTAELLSRLASA